MYFISDIVHHFLLLTITHSTLPSAGVVAQLSSIRPRTSEQRGKTQERHQTVLIGQAGAGRAYDRSGRGRNKNDDEKGSGEAGNCDEVDSDAIEKERGTDSNNDEGSK